VSAATATIAVDIITELTRAWGEYQTVERKGLAFGQRLYELRAHSEVVQGGTTFTSSLDKAGIPRRTAHYWIQNYEVSIGVREEKVVKDASVVQAEQPTTSGEVPYRTEPLAPTSEPKAWTRDMEKRKNRSKPAESEQALIRIGLRALTEGQKVLKGKVDPSQLHAAVTLAKFRVRGEQ
jgi:hypothetical protein